MPAKIVSIPDIGDVHIYKRKKARNLRLSLNHEGKIRISTPYWMPYSAAIKYAETKKDWITRHNVKTPHLANFARIGKSHRLYFIPDTTKSRPLSRLSKTEINVYHPKEHDITSEIVQSAANKASIRALKKQSAILLPNRLETLAYQHGLDYSSVAIKQLTGRWGSCSSTKDIALSCFLIQLPWHLIDYVLLHELTHTRVMRHGAPFWQEMSRYSPNYKILRKEIKSYNPVVTPFE